MRRPAISWALVFSLAATAAGGCERSTPDQVRRAPRAAETATELLDVDSVDTTKELRITEDLIGGWTPPPVASTVRPAVRLTPERPAPAVAPKPVTSEARAEPEAEAQRSPTAGPGPATPEAARPHVKAERPAERSSWYTPPPKGPHQTAINVLIGVGAFAVTLGNLAVTEDGSLGDRTFAITSLGIGAASFGTAFVLWATEPTPRPGVRVSVAPGMLGLRGNF